MRVHNRPHLCSSAKICVVPHTTTVQQASVDKTFKTADYCARQILHKISKHKQLRSPADQLWCSSLAHPRETRPGLVELRLMQSFHHQGRQFLTPGEPESRRQSSAGNQSLGSTWCASDTILQHFPDLPDYHQQNINPFKPFYKQI